MSQAGAAFSFLDTDAKLKHNFAEAERHATSSPDSAVRAARVFAELLLERVAELRGHPRQTINGEEESFFKFINRLRDQEKCISFADASLLHAIRDMGNDASHGEKIFSPAEGRTAVENIRKLALQFQPDLQGPKTSSSQTFSNANAGQKPSTASASSSDNIYEFARAAKPPPPPPRPPPAYAADTQASPSNAEGPIVFGIIAAVALGIFLVWHGSNTRYVATPQQPAQPEAQNAPSAPAVVAFPSPEIYIVSPAGTLKDVNERSGAGTGYGVVQKITRDTQVTGTGRAVDADGFGWIQLNDGNFIKETLLTAYVPPAAPAESVPPTTPSDAAAATDTSTPQPQSDSNAGDDVPQTQTVPPTLPPLVQYQVCPPAGTPLPCQLAYAQAGAPPPQFEYPQGYQPPTYPTVGQPQPGFAPQGIPGNGLTFSFRIGPGHRHP